jgi:hypothetical protein
MEYWHTWILNSRLIPVAKMPRFALFLDTTSQVAIFQEVGF